MQLLWLGYDGLSVDFDEIIAVLSYTPVLDARIQAACGRVPPGVRAVVVTRTGLYMPARLPVEQLRARWARWRVGA